MLHNLMGTHTHLQNMGLAEHITIAAPGREGRALIWILEQQI
jgi:hypothetical protein